MRSFNTSLILSLFLMISNANAACVYTSYTENDGSVSEINFPVTGVTAKNLSALGYQTVACKKEYSIQQINQKCAKMQKWPEKIKDVFITRFKISAAQMCQYSLEYVNSQK